MARMTISKAIPALLGIFYAAGVLAADADLDAAARSAPGRERFPDADAVVLKEERTVALDGEGRRTERFYRLVKIFTSFGQKHFCDPRFPFDEATQTFKLVRARTRMRDGTIVDTPGHGVNVVTPGALADFPAWASRREAVVSHVGVENDALLEIETVVEDRSGGRRGIDGVELFGGAFPVLEKTLVVKVPEGDTLASAVQGAAWFLPGRVTVDKGGRWSMKNISAAPEEPSAPSLPEIVPCVAYSTRSSWTSWGDDFAERFGRASSAPLPPDLGKSLEEIKARHPGPSGRIAAIEGLIARRVRCVEFPFESRDFRPADRVWSEGYGNAADRAALLCACYRVLDVAACPVWTASDRSPLDPGLCVPSRLGALWLEARTEDGTMWVPALGRGMEEGYLAPPSVWRFHPGRGEAAGPEKGSDPQPEDLSAQVTGTVRLSADGSAEIRLVLVLKGRLNPHARSLAGEGDAKGFVEERLRRLFPDGSVRNCLEAYSGRHKTVLSVDAVVGAAVSKQGTLAFLIAPGSLFLPELGVPASDRALPYRFPCGFSETVELRIEAPPGWSFSAAPSPFSGEVKGVFRLSVLGWHSDGSAFLFRSIEATGADVGEGEPPAAGPKMQEFRGLLARWKAEASRTVVFETSKR